MLPFSTKGGGKCAAFPDVCKVPAPAPPGFVPTPFPNVGNVATADKTTNKVFITNKSVVVEGSEIPRSSGDEPGTLKGMVSATSMGKVTYKTHVGKVKFEGKSSITVTASTSQNGGNSVGAQVAPSQTKVILNF